MSSSKPLAGQKDEEKKKKKKHKEATGTASTDPAELRTSLRCSGKAQERGRQRGLSLLLAVCMPFSVRVRSPLGAQELLDLTEDGDGEIGTC